MSLGLYFSISVFVDDSIESPLLDMHNIHFAFFLDFDFEQKAPQNPSRPKDGVFLLKQGRGVWLEYSVFIAEMKLSHHS